MPLLIRPLVLLMLLFVLVPSSSADDALREKIRAAWAERTANSKTVIVRWEENVIYPTGAFDFLAKGLGNLPLPKQQPEKDVRVRNVTELTLNGSKSNVWRDHHIWNAVDNKFARKEWISTHDGEFETQIFKGGRSLPHGNISKEASNSGFMDSAWPMVAALRGLGKETSRIGAFEDTPYATTKGEGENAVVILHSTSNEAASHQRVECLPKYSYLPRVREHREYGGKPRVITTVKTMRTMEGGVVVPETWTTDCYLNGKLFTQSECKLILCDLKANVESTEYRLRFPVGMVVNDQRGTKSTRYVVTEDD